MRVPSRLIACAALAALWLFGVGATAPAGAQIKPEIKTLVNQSAKAYANMKSYQHTEMLVVKQGEQKQEAKFTLALERPNKFHLEINEGQLQIAGISDGKNLINLRGDTHEYTRKPAPDQVKDLLGSAGLSIRPVMATYFIAMMLQGTNPLDAPGPSQALAQGTLRSNVMQGGKTWQVLAFAGPDASAIELYIDKETHLVGKADIKMPAQSMEFIGTLQDVQIDKPVPASVFAFTPPATAKLVEKFTDPEEKATAELAAKYEGKPAPDFTLKDLNGKEIALSSLKGKVVVVDFWASWCGPCQMVMPTIQEIHEKLADKGVEVLAVNTWDAAADCKSFLKANPKYTMTVLMDPAEKNGGASVATKLYGVQGIPTTLIIDKDGKVSKYLVGAHERAEYMNALKSLGIEVALR